MESATFKDTAKIIFCRGLLVWMDKRKQRFSDKEVCFGVKMIGEDRVKVDELEVCRE
jgi:hypothetical protein